eukprot:Phypoly_transcript_03671.p1 GENE.Phypoly_transcript_03671~~Phypoly_transcript_03671.p1  ORF type:complete len:255 (+),score=23.41 Phypoly_transcript_03671:116-880(+)
MNAFITLAPLLLFILEANALSDAVVFSRTPYYGTSGEILILYPNRSVVKILDGVWPRISTDKSKLLFKNVTGTSYLPLTWINGYMFTYGLSTGKIENTNKLSSISYTLLADNERIFYDYEDNETVIWANGTVERSFNQSINPLLNISTDAPDRHPTNPNLFVISNFWERMMFWEQDFSDPTSSPNLTFVTDAPTQFHFAPVFSPDGFSVATVYTDSQFGNGNVAIIKNGIRTSVTSNAGGDGLEIGIAWSSDGK